jgi:hypothetical protein
MNMNEMRRMPGFSAEFTLYQTTGHYPVKGNVNGARGHHAGLGSVIPSICDNRCQALLRCCYQSEIPQSCCDSYEIEDCDCGGIRHPVPS